MSTSTSKCALTAASCASWCRCGTGRESWERGSRPPPRSIRWDKGNWILDITDFPRSTAMMRYQLVNDDDVLGRAEAVDVLAQRPADQLALDGLVRAMRNDRFWGVRARAVDAVGIWGGEPNRADIPAMHNVRTALIYATRDPDARVRQSAATALGRLTVSGNAAMEVTIRLREMARSDPSLIVRGCGACLRHPPREERSAPSRQAAHGDGRLAERNSNPGAGRAQDAGHSGGATAVAGVRAGAAVEPDSHTGPMKISIEYCIV